MSSTAKKSRFFDTVKGLTWLQVGKVRFLKQIIVRLEILYKRSLVEILWSQNFHSEVHITLSLATKLAPYPYPLPWKFYISTHPYPYPYPYPLPLDLYACGSGSALCLGFVSWSYVLRLRVMWLRSSGSGHELRALDFVCLLPAACFGFGSWGCVLRNRVPLCASGSGYHAAIFWVRFMSCYCVFVFWESVLRISSYDLHASGFGLWPPCVVFRLSGYKLRVGLWGRTWILLRASGLCLMKMCWLFVELFSFFFIICFIFCWIFRRIFAEYLLKLY